MPAFNACFGVEKFTFFPLTEYSPESAVKTPEIILTNVDLPAPLSPKRQ